MDFPDRAPYAIIVLARVTGGDERLNTTTLTAMDTTESANLFVHLLPSLIPPGALRGGVAVVVDVLRATTVIVRALSAGCTNVLPCREIQEAKSLAMSFPRDTVLLAGERGGLPIRDFNLGNSPGEFVPEVCREKHVVITTTNGTRAILASLEAEHVYVASFNNLQATADEISVQILKKHHGHSVHIVCAGTEGQISLEDSLLAGALTSQIANVVDLRPDPAVAKFFGNDEALLTLAQWLEAARVVKQRPFWQLLSLGRGGQNLLKLGLQLDIEEAALIDSCDWVAKLMRDPLRIVAV
jgi:2-phosphosulfolactate phosphatase